MACCLVWLQFGSTYCLVTELVAGGDLCALLQQQRGKGLGEKGTRRLSRQVVAALQYLHRRGVVHRSVPTTPNTLSSDGLANIWQLGY